VPWASGTSASGTRRAGGREQRGGGLAAATEAVTVTVTATATVTVSLTVSVPVTVIVTVTGFLPVCGSPGSLNGAQLRGSQGRRAHDTQARGGGGTGWKQWRRGVGPGHTKGPSGRAPGTVWGGGAVTIRVCVTVHARVTVRVSVGVRAGGGGLLSEGVTVAV